MDQYRTVEKQGYGTRVKNSFMGVLVGIIFFLVSIFLLWHNEGNLAAEKIALKELAASTVEASIDEITPDTVGKPVHLVGELLSDEQVGDPGYIAAGDYLKLRRRAEMFQWVEDERTENSNNESTKVKTYTYKQEWRMGRVDSSQFYHQVGHENPSPRFTDADFAVSSGTFGAWSGNDVLDHVWPDEELELTEDMLDPERSGGSLENGYLYYRMNPAGVGNKIGDERLSWTVLYPGTYSVIAKHEADNRLSAFVASNGKEKFLTGPGSASIQEMITNDRNAQSMLAWLLRLAGFLLMWIGLSLTLGPIAALLSIIPGAATVGRFATGLVSFVTALALTVATVIISWVAHNPIVLGVAIVAVLAGSFAWMKKKQPKAATLEI